MIARLYAHCPDEVATVAESGPDPVMMVVGAVVGVLIAIGLINLLDW